MADTEPTFTEKVLVNTFTPMNNLIFRVLDCEEPKAPTKDGVGSRYQERVENYERLLQHLEEDGLEDKVLSKYMSTVCGRINVRLAQRREYLTQQDYEKLASDYDISY